MSSGCGLCHRTSVTIFLLLLLLFVNPLLASAGQVNVFIYHRFGESRYPSTNISTDLFASHLQFLKDKQLPVVSLAEVVDTLRAGRSLPEKAVAITVDDAFDSFQSAAMPLLRQYGYPVTLFVNTDSVGGKGYLDWDSLRQLVAEGVVIGNHTATHDYLLDRSEGEGGAQWQKRVRDDIKKAQDAFSREIGQRPALFAYPYGEYSPELMAIVESLGFSAGIAQQSGVVSTQSELFALPRFPMGGPYASLRSFRDKVAMSALDVEVIAPVTPVIGDGESPLLTLRVDAKRYDLRRLQGFVQGENRLVFDRSKIDMGFVSVRAEKPLAGRRNKYTLTAPLADGSGWAWFSHPWFQPKSGR